MQNLVRPSNFNEFIGQHRLIATLEIMIASAQKRKVALDHILLYGAPGLGKTSLAHIIASQMQAKMRFAQGPMLEKKADILALFGSLAKGDVIFIDEIHGINKNVEELLYSALEDGFIDVAIGVEGESKIVRMKLPQFSLIGATTKIGRVSLPLKDRFGLLGKFLNYDSSEIATILRNSAARQKISINDMAIDTIVSFSRNIPRVANTLLRRALDFQLVANVSTISNELVLQAFAKMGLYPLGLTEQHLGYLLTLRDAFGQNWTALETLAGSLIESKQTIEQEIEPILLTLNFVEKSSKGRKLTSAGLTYLNVNAIN